MDAKISLAELYAGYNLPMSQYKELPAFRYMESQPELVEKIEPLHLPEITKLICGSQAFRKQSWSDVYRKIRTYICNPDKIDVSQIVLSCKTIDCFEKEVLPYASEQILSAIERDYADLTVQKQNVSHNYDLLRSKCMTPGSDSAANKTNSAEQQRDAQKQTDYMQLKECEKELRELQLFLDVEKPFVDSIILYRQKETPEEIEQRREQAFLLLEDTRSREELFLDSYIQTGMISATEKKLFHRASFVRHLMELLDTNRYRNFAFPVLFRLYDEGAVDLVEGPASDYVEEHPQNFADYLVQQAIDVNSITEDTELLIEKALKLELYGETVGTAFWEFWNTFTSEKSWIRVIKLLPEIIDEEQCISAVSHMVTVVQDEAQEALLHVIFQWNDPDIYLDPEEVMLKLGTASRYIQTDLFCRISKLWNQRCRDLQRKLNTVQRRMARQEQELFSAVYRPTEQLEELAANLKATDGTIRTDLVAAQLMTSIEELRIRLQDLGLEPVVDPHDWREQTPVSYNSQIHNLLIQHEKTSRMVQLNSMGFRYRDDEGNWQIYRARVSEVNAPEKEKSHHRQRTHSDPKKHREVSAHETGKISEDKNQKQSKK